MHYAHLSRFIRNVRAFMTGGSAFYDHKVSRIDPLRRVSSIPLNTAAHYFWNCNVAISVKGELSRRSIGVALWTESRVTLSGFRFKKSVRRNWHTAVSCMLLLAFCSAVLPIPWPNVEIRSSDTSVPFPCQSRGCGCMTAHHCWTKCCCHSPAERLAWANKNKVTPPAYAILSHTPEPKTTSLHKMRGKVEAPVGSDTVCDGSFDRLHTALMSTIALSTIALPDLSLAFVLSSRETIRHGVLAR